MSDQDEIDAPPAAPTFAAYPPAVLAAKGQKPLQVTENAFGSVYSRAGWTREPQGKTAAKAVTADPDSTPAPTKAPAKTTTRKRRTSPPPPTKTEE